MKFEHIQHFSSNLNQDMSVGVYGHSGKIIVAFASQDGKYHEYADFGMVEQMSKWIDAGQIMVVTPDSIDEETWSNKYGDMGYRSYRLEAWYHYIVDEFVPMIQQRYNRFDGFFTTGCSMGATHAVNFFLRRPDLFDGCIALSGLYSSKPFFGDYMDENVYNVSPVNFMANMPEDHPYINMYNERTFIVCIGQGAWEDELLPYNHQLEDICKAKGINGWFDYWGYDVNHDWPWWKVQIVYFLEKIFG